jgi:hypothetical protein
MEPLEVIRDLLRDPAERKPVNSQTIGGPPQLLRVFVPIVFSPTVVVLPTPFSELASSPISS